MKLIILIAVIAVASAEIIDPQVVCGDGEEKVCPTNPCTQNTCAGLLRGVSNSNLCTPNSGNDQAPCAEGDHKICRCISGYARNANNVCIPKDDCCPAGQSFTTCKRTCKAVNNNKECEQTDRLVCGCEVGTYFSSISNTCVAKDDCAAIDTHPKCDQCDGDGGSININVQNNNDLGGCGGCGNCGNCGNCHCDRHDNGHHHDNHNKSKDGNKSKDHNKSKPNVVLKTKVKL